MEELLVERGVEVDHVTVFRWVQRFTPLLADAARFTRHAAGDRWFVDETYVKADGVWRYVYRPSTSTDRSSTPKRSTNSLKAIIVTAATALRDTLKDLSDATLIRRCAALPDTTYRRWASPLRHGLAGCTTSCCRDSARLAESSALAFEGMDEDHLAGIR